MNSELIKATHSLEFTLMDLQAALASATSTEAIILLPLVTRVRVLRDEVETLRTARTADCGEYTPSGNEVGRS